MKSSLRWIYLAAIPAALALGFVGGLAAGIYGPWRAAGECVTAPAVGALPAFPAEPAPSGTAAPAGTGAATRSGATTGPGATAAPTTAPGRTATAPAPLPPTTPPRPSSLYGQPASAYTPGAPVTTPRLKLVYQVANVNNPVAYSLYKDIYRSELTMPIAVLDWQYSILSTEGILPVLINPYVPNHDARYVLGMLTVEQYQRWEQVRAKYPGLLKTFLEQAGAAAHQQKGGANLGVTWAVVDAVAEKPAGFYPNELQQLDDGRWLVIRPVASVPPQCTEAFIFAPPAIAPNDHRSTGIWSIYGPYLKYDAVNKKLWDQ